MVRFLLRSIGLILLSAAFVAVVIDGTRTIAASDLVLTPLGETWFDLSPDTLNLAQATVQTRLPGWVWVRLATPLLQQPTFAVLGVLGIVFMLLGHRRARRSVAFVT